jgi:hypothetical protein
MAIKSTVLDMTATSVYTSVGRSAVTLVYFCNTSPGQLTFNMHLVPNGQIASDTNVVYYSIQIAASDTFVLETERIILENGDSIVAAASLPSSIVTTVNYVSL